MRENEEKTEFSRRRHSFERRKESLIGEKRTFCDQKNKNQTKDEKQVTEQPFEWSTNERAHRALPFIAHFSPSLSVVPPDVAVERGGGAVGERVLGYATGIPSRVVFRQTFFDFCFRLLFKSFVQFSENVFLVCLES